MLGAAGDAIEEIEEESQSLPVAFFSLRYSIYSALGRWNLAEAAARQLVLSTPTVPEFWVNWAHAARRSLKIEDARRILLEAERHHPQYGTIQFNLGCYSCVLGDNDEAKRQVSAAISLDSQFRALALDDQDLQPLWDEIAKGQNA